MKTDSQRRPIRHCMVVHNRYPFEETRVQREAKALIESGIEVDVICLQQDDEPTTETVDSVDVFRVPISRDRKRGRVARLFEYFASFFLMFLLLSRLQLKKRYDVVQVHNLPDFLVFVALLPRLMGSKVILDIHDLMPEFYCSRFQCSFDSLAVRLVRLQEWLSCRFAHHVITVTESWRQTLIGRSVSPGKCSVVMNLADTRDLGTARAEHHRGRNGNFQLIYHGSLTYRYGVDLALRALDLVRREIADVHLIMHGRGEYLEKLLELIDELGLKPFVSVSTTTLSWRELNELIVSADVGLVPYRSDIFTDGILPTKLMEYVAVNVPVIAARTPGIRAYFDQGMVEFFTAGEIDELANCIRTLHRDRNRLSELARNARAFHDRYNWQDQASQYVRGVRAIVNANG